MGVRLGVADRPIVQRQRGPSFGIGRQTGGVCPEGWSTAAAHRGDGRANKTGTGPSKVAPGAKERAFEFERTLGWASGVRGTPQSADGQQRRRADGTRSGGVAKEQLRIGSRVGGQTGGDAVQRVSNAVLVEYQSEGVADGLSASVRES